MAIKYVVKCSISPKRSGSDRWVQQGVFNKYKPAVQKAASSARKYKKSKRAGVCFVSQHEKTKKGTRIRGAFSTGWFVARKPRKPLRRRK